MLPCSYTSDTTTECLHHSSPSITQLLYAMDPLGPRFPTHYLMLTLYTPPGGGWSFITIKTLAGCIADFDFVNFVMGPFPIGFAHSFVNIPPSVHISI